MATTSLTLSTKSVALTDETAYGNYVSSLNSYIAQRDTLTTTIKSYIDAAAFSGGPFDATYAASLTSQANAMVAQMQTMAGGH